MEYKTNGKGLQMNMPQRRRIFRIPDQQKYINSYYPALFCVLSVWCLCLPQLITVNDQLSAAAFISFSLLWVRRLFQLGVKHWGEYREIKVKICILDYDNLCRSFSVFTWNLLTVFILSTCHLFDLTVSNNRLKKWFFLTKSLVESQVFRFYYECIYMKDSLSIVLMYWIMYWMLEDSQHSVDKSNKVFI